MGGTAAGVLGVSGSGTLEGEGDEKKRRPSVDGAESVEGRLGGAPRPRDDCVGVTESELGRAEAASRILARPESVCRLLPATEEVLATETLRLARGVGVPLSIAADDARRRRSTMAVTLSEHAHVDVKAMEESTVPLSVTTARCGVCELVVGARLVTGASSAVPRLENDRLGCIVALIGVASYAS